jgi:hypothetical protein
MIALRLDGHLMRGIADSQRPDRLLAYPIGADRVREQRKGHDSGRVLVAGPRIKLGHATAASWSRLVGTPHLRVLQGGEEVAVRALHA